MILFTIGILTALLNRGTHVDLHFSFIRNPLLFYVSAVATTTAVLICGTKIRNNVVQWCGKNSLILMLCQTGVAYLCKIANALTGGMTGINVYVKFFLSLLTLGIGLLMSGVVVWIIHNTWLNILIQLPEKSRKER